MYSSSEETRRQPTPASRRQVVPVSRDTTHGLFILEDKLRLSNPYKCTLTRWLTFALSTRFKSISSSFYNLGKSLGRVPTLWRFNIFRDLFYHNMSLSSTAICIINTVHIYSLDEQFPLQYSNVTTAIQRMRTREQRESSSRQTGVHDPP